MLQALLSPAHSVVLSRHSALSRHLLPNSRVLMSMNMAALSYYWRALNSTSHNSVDNAEV